VTERKKKIVKSILEVLSNLDGGQIAEPTLHAEANLRIVPSASKGEFDDALKYCDDRNWVTGIESKFGGKLWQSNDMGEAVRLQLNRQ
jgi:hypothetical protein